MDPAVSVLTPTYNRTEYVGGAVETVLNQTADDVESVVVVDGSTDGTREALAPYRDDDRVTVRYNDRNRGIAYSFNRAAELAEGEYYCILGDDDRWHPRKVERQLDRFDALSPEYGVVYTGGVLTADGQTVDRYVPERRGDLFPEILEWFDLHPHSSHMIRREAFEDVGGFDTSFPQGVDWEMSIRLARDWKFEYVDEPLVERRSHDDNVSSRDSRLEISQLIWEKHGEDIRAHPGIERTFRGNWEYNRAYVHAENGRHRDAVRHAWRALRVRPTPFHAVVFGLCLLGPRAFDLAGNVRAGVTDLLNDVENPGDSSDSGISEGSGESHNPETTSAAERLSRMREESETPTGSVESDTSDGSVESDTSDGSVEGGSRSGAVGDDG